MTFKLKIDNKNRQVFARLSDSVRSTNRGIRQAFYFIGKDHRDTASTNILKKPRTGKVYKRRISGGAMRRHTASVAGESFANLTGKARRSLGWDVRGASQLEFGFRERGDAPYTEGLEEGTENVKARPTLQISVTANQRNTMQHFEKELKKALKEGFR